MAYEPKTWADGETVTPLALNNMENGLAEANGDYVPHEWKCGEVVSADLLNHIEQGIANAGGGSSRVLLYENDALDISSEDKGCVFKAITPSLATNAWINMGIGNDVSLVLSVDGETLSAAPQLNTSGYAYYIGLQDPGDTEHIGIYKMGCMLTKTTSAGKDFTQDFSFITLDGNYFTAGTHSVKIYAEL